MMRIMKHILNYSDKKLTIIIFSFVSLPRILVIIVLLTEVVIGHLHYYFYALYLLLIPLLFRIILFLFKDVQERSFPEASSMVIQEMNPITINNKLSFTVTFKLKPEYAVDGDPNIFFPKLYFPLLYFGGQIKVIYEIYRKFTLFTQCVYYLVHVICFSYILFIV